MQFWQGGRIEAPPAAELGDDMRVLRVAMIGVVLVTAGTMRLNGGQMPPPMQQGPVGSRQVPGMPQKQGADEPANPLDSHRAEQQEKMRNTDRQKRLVADTEKLLALATDLKEQVDKSTKDTLSVEVIKKADEIEKLAHSVKERMKG
jgi:hypothetical protein